MLYLLEKLEAGGDTGPDLETAVARQLDRLAAIHAWEMPAGLADSLGLGLPAVTDLGRSSGADLARYAQALERVIRRHEPRLQGARVLIRPPGPHTPASLVVEALLAEDGGPRPFRFVLPSA